MRMEADKKVAGRQEVGQEQSLQTSSAAFFFSRVSI